MSAARDAAIRAGCDAQLRCTYPDCLKLHMMAGVACRTHKRQSINSIAGFLDAVENSQQPISHDAMQTLRAHLGEG